jgi:hypothetical protein
VVTFFAIRSTAVDVYFSVVENTVVTVIRDFIVIVEAACQKKRAGKNSKKQEYERAHFHR